MLDKKVHFSCSARENQPVAVDYYPPVGDGQGYTSLELFLISLSTCVSTAVLIVLRKMHKDIQYYEVKASGVRRENHPTCFETVTLDFKIKSPDITKEDVDKALKLSEASICPVWAMIKGNVTVKTNIVIEV